jgi:uncharacterized protein
MRTTMNERTPIDLCITPRDRRFGRDAAQRRWWLAGDPIATAFFIESVKAHREGAPEKLQREIRAFVTQEVMHSREHVAFNKRIVESGYDVSILEKAVTDSLALTKGRPEILNLAVTMALEHYTAIMAQQMLNDDRVFAGGDPEQVALWKWHAVEEIEHKGVAYDTWLHATRDWSRWKRWKVKSLMMLIVTSRFWPKRVKGMLHLLAQDDLKGPRIWGRIASFMLGNPGVLRSLFFPWLAYFMPGFHPWNHDDRALIKLVDSDYSAARLPDAIAA